MMMQLAYKSSHSCWSRKYKQSVCQPPGYRGMKGGSHRGRKEWMLCFIRVFPRVFHKCVFVCVRKRQRERERERENLQTLKKPPSLNWHLCVFLNVLKGLGGGQDDTVSISTDTYFYDVFLRVLGEFRRLGLSL